MSRSILQPETHVHDMVAPFHFLRHLRACGLGNYPARAMVCIGTTVTGADTDACRKDLLRNHEFNRRVQIGADKLVIVHGDDLMMGLIRDENLLSRVRASIFEQLRPLRMYLSRNMDPLVKKLGLSWEDVLTPDWEIAGRFDNKLQIRMMSLALDGGGFTPWRYVKSEDAPELYQARREVLEESDLFIPTEVVFLKRPDFDGGEGIFRWDPHTPPKKLRCFLDEHAGHDLLLEAGYPRDLFDMQEASVQVEITEDNWEPLYPSLQITSNNAHSGNELLIGEHLIEAHVWKRMCEIQKPFCDYAVQSGYGRRRPRRMGFDYMIVRSMGETHVFCGEINARDTAPQYAYAVAQQAAPRIGDRAAVVMENLPVAKYRDHESLEARLGELLWNGETSSGVLIGNAGCISHGKVTMFCIGKTLDEARATRQRLPPL